MRFALFCLAFLPALAWANPPMSGALWIGDSISYGRFGAKLDSFLRARYPSVVTISSCGTTPAAWVTPPGTPPDQHVKTNCGFWRKTDTTELRAKQHPTPKAAAELGARPALVTIVQLGTNVAAGRVESHRATSRLLMDDIVRSGSRCVWLGPPAANSRVVTRAKLAATNALLREEAQKAGCAFVDLLAVTRFPAGPGDGIHPSPALAEEWAGQAAELLIPLLP